MVSVARQAVAAVTEGRPLEVKAEGRARPVFVTIEIDGTIRGCRGSLVARTRSLSQEIAEAARSAAAFDPRYKPLAKSELKRFLVTVTVIDSLDSIQSVTGLGPDAGLVLKSGTKSGVVLPWEGKDPQVRLEWAYRKAGVRSGAPVSLYRMVAERYRG